MYFFLSFSIKNTFQIFCKVNSRYLKQIGFAYCGISTEIKTLKNIVIGYKVNNQEYSAVNEILAIIGFSIHKTYFISESRSKKIDSFIIFCNEIIALMTLLKHGNKSPNKFTLQIEGCINSLS